MFTKTNPIPIKLVYLEGSKKQGRDYTIYKIALCVENKLFDSEYTTIQYSSTNEVIHLQQATSFMRGSVKTTKNIAGKYKYFVLTRPIIMDMLGVPYFTAKMPHQHTTGYLQESGDIVIQKQDILKSIKQGISKMDIVDLSKIKSTEMLNTPEEIASFTNAVDDPTGTLASLTMSKNILNEEIGLFEKSENKEVQLSIKNNRVSIMVLTEI